MMMIGHLRRRLIRGIGANLYGQIIAAFIQLAGVPILLQAWGLQLYGEWLILFAVPSYLSMTDLGFSASAGNDMTVKVAQGEKAQALAVFQSISLLISITSLIAFAVSIILILVLPIHHWLHVGTLSALDTRLTLILLTASVLVNLFDGINHAGFRANGDYALHVTLNSTVPLLQQIVIWVVAFSGNSILDAAFGYFLVRLIAVPALYLLLLKRHRWLKFGFAHARLAELRRLSAPAMGNLAIPFAMALNLQGMVLVVASFLGPVAVVVFSTLRTLTRLTLQLVAQISNAAEPEFAGLDIETSKQPLVDLYNQMIRASFWISVMAVLFLSLFGSRLLASWTHGRVAMNESLFFWLLATVVSQTLWWGALTMLRSRNRHMNAAAAQFAAACFCLLLAIFLLSMTHNIAYAGFALFIGDICYMIYVMNNVQHLLGVSVFSSLISALDPRPLRALIRNSRNA